LSDDSVLLQRYLDGDLSAPEVEALRARLAQSPELARQLGEFRRVGSLIRLWADQTEARGRGLVEPTLRRVHAAEQKRTRHATLGFALAAALVVVLPFASQAHFVPRAVQLAAPRLVPGAAIERIDAADKHAQVFVVGAASTPVVWLADEAGDDGDTTPLQDPG
jgi:anti-sigma factor RsiW